MYGNSAELAEECRRVGGLARLVVYSDRLRCRRALRVCGVDVLSSGCGVGFGVCDGLGCFWHLLGINLPLFLNHCCLLSSSVHVRQQSKQPSVDTVDLGV